MAASSAIDGSHGCEQSATPTAYISNRKRIISLESLADNPTLKKTIPTSMDFDGLLRECTMAFKTSFCPTSIFQTPAYEKLENQAESLVGALRNIKNGLHKHMTSHLVNDLKLHDMAVELYEMLLLIKNVDTRSPRERMREAMGHHMVDLPLPSATMVDSIEGLKEMLVAVVEGAKRTGDNPDLSVNAEGRKLGCDGTISMIQIFIGSLDHAYLVDVATLGAAAFTTTTAIDDEQVSLKSILEDSDREKVMFDCRGDAEALYALYGITLRGIHDIQLMDIITRNRGKSRASLKGMKQVTTQRLQNTTIANDTLSRFEAVKYWGVVAIQHGFDVAESEHEFYDGDWKARDKVLAKKKSDADRLLAQEIAANVYRCERELAERLRLCGSKASDTSTNGMKNDSPVAVGAEGSPVSSTSSPTLVPSDAEAPVLTTEVSTFTPPTDPFTIRPLPQSLVAYATNDVAYLLILYDHFATHRLMTDAAADIIKQETLDRLILSRMPGGYKKNSKLAMNKVSPELKAFDNGVVEETDE
ncbi:hypothetical protein B0A48_02906 [Cryoendolithus antarcticus]|uniref:3'-5' exonuclease domain-containing protein n=1 Tax=Cryoendolithus antarcticus TaxID=1507870 RepID=A0A1V8TLM0_9PEZI|nr:hypothetical protein B0A48_02906 [Cryoendolithus antarcticus]